MNNDFYLRNIPSVKDREFKYRTKINSSVLNEMQSEYFNDILELFNKANDIQKKLYEMEIANGIEGACYSARLIESSIQLKELEARYNNITSGKNNYRYLTQYAYNAETVQDGYEAIIDRNTNDITAHIMSSVNKIKLYDGTYDEYLVAPSLITMIGPDDFIVGGDILSIEDSNINNAFDGNKGTSWIRTVKTTANIQEIENEIVIGLPEDIITSRQVNQISIHPFPVGYIDIVNVQYKSNGSWQSIPGFKTHDGYEVQSKQDLFGNSINASAINDAMNIKLNFKSLETNQLKIKLRQRHYITDAENNRRIWYLGLRDVDVVHNTYTREHSQFEMTYEFTEKNATIKIIDTEIHFNNPELNETSDDNFNTSIEYFYFDSDGNTHKIIDSLPFVLNSKDNKLMLRFTIDGGQTTPSIHSATVKYKLG